MNKIAILGGGEIGSALAQALSTKKESPLVWDKMPERNKSGMEMRDVVSDADFIFFCTPSFVLRSAIIEAKPFLKDDAICIILSKGLEQDSGKTTSQVARESLQNTNFAIFGGPMIAEEVVAGRHGFAEIGSTGEVFDRLSDLLEGTPIKPIFSEDPDAVALAGVFKNIYALGLGIADALDMGDNFKGWFTAKAVKEMEIIIPSLGGKSGGVATSVAGLGDLIATGFSKNSKNHETGKELIETGDVKTKGEGLLSLPQASLLIKDKASLPLFSAIEEIFINKQNPRETYEKLGW